MNSDFFNLMVLFGVFIFLMLLMWPLTVIIMVKRLLSIQMRARIKIKLIPSKDLMKMKLKADKSEKHEENED